MGKERGLFRLLTTGSLVIAGCVPEMKSTRQPQPTESQTGELTPLPVITETPMQTPILTATMTPLPTEILIPTPEVPYQVENGLIMEWRDGGWREAALPEGTREIAMIEQHEGSWYGIDTYGRATVKLSTTGEWEKYERPIKIAAYSERFPREEILRAMHEEVSPEEERRLLNADGSNLQYGYLFEEPVKGREERIKAFVSGFPIGTFRHQDWQMILFEIPFRYERQIILFFNADRLIDVPGDTRISMYLGKIPESRNIEEREKGRIRGRDLAQIFENNPDVIGEQMVFSFIYIRPEYQEWGLQREFENLIQALKEGRAIDSEAHGVLCDIWASAALFEK